MDSAWLILFGFLLCLVALRRFVKDVAFVLCLGVIMRQWLNSLEEPDRIVMDQAAQVLANSIGGMLNHTRHMLPNVF